MDNLQKQKKVNSQEFFLKKPLQSVDTVFLWSKYFSGIAAVYVMLRVCNIIIILDPTD